jgi:hypothetical protein
VAALPVVLLLSIDGSASKPYELSYAASADCPSEAAFRADVRSRVENAAAADGARLDVRIEARAEGYAGHIVVRDAAGGTGRRTIEGATCNEVAGALAFLTALAIDLGGQIEELRPVARPPPKVPPAPQSAPPAPKRPPPPRPFSLSPLAVGPVARGGFRVGFGTGLAPAAELAVFVGTSHAHGFAPRLELSTAFSRGTVTRPEGGAELVLLASRLTGCPVRLGVDTFGVRPCAGLEVGGVFARGVDIPGALSQRHPWLASEIGAQVEWRFASRFFLELAGGPGFPALRQRYYFAPNTPVHTFPPVTVRANIGVGAVF